MAAPKESEVELFPLLGERAVEYLGRELSLAEMWVLKKLPCLLFMPEKKDSHKTE